MVGCGPVAQPSPVPIVAKTSSLPPWARVLYGVSHPIAILPVATVVAAWFGSYSPADITQLQNVPLFLPVLQQ